MLPRRLQQRVGAEDVGLDESTGPIDGTIDMGLGGQMHHHIWLMGSKDPVKCCPVANISLLERIQRVGCHGRHIREASGISQRIKVDDRMAAGHRQTDHG